MNKTIYRTMLAISAILLILWLNVGAYIYAFALVISLTMSIAYYALDEDSKPKRYVIYFYDVADYNNFDIVNVIETDSLEEVARHTKVLRRIVAVDTISGEIIAGPFKGKKYRKKGNFIILD